MIDPYKVLGVSRDASDDEVKKAYRALSRKYHPDANINNPLKEEAEAKFKEVQQAYQQIMDEREKGYTGQASGYGPGYGGQQGAGSYGGFGRYGGFGNFGGFGGYGPGSSQGYTGNSESDIHLRAAVNYIQSGHYKEALNVLDGIRDRGALWYFYSASAHSGMGNNVTALEHAKEAVRLEPNNMQYQMLLNRLQGTGGWYQQRQRAYGYPTMGGNDFCVKLCVANLACNLCCGSGICCNGGGYGGGFGGYT
ncbi:MAG: J domain-containing protein [Faecalicatena sp.]|uniref:J domain-containing protein n=1 Tax=Faecalicatena sp. TaxID=2005360 RepID=UPI00258C216F|nr:J domain-containing protein [Faecalicatena sp.]MCI6464512.1 J domain-containing protein [Faecalicatena sp.]MDY5619074.1 J domain-containing protein [Lachnospiraceae bacterium]